MEHSETMIWDYIADNWVVSFTTITENDFWSANAFYILDIQNFSLIILSSKETRHGKILMQNPLVSGTISNQIEDISQLKGIQFAGEMTLLEEKEAEIAYAKYCQRFPIAKTKKETVWKLSFSQVKYMDNSLGFGAKLYWNK
ncbi:MAG: hypothetical protein DI598_07470 [Pseudopedobacter saltans]|uniref:Pyridoxamine 5'-phosphate oxidase putative domain-containing protein n=1 Tax=Pseudopedobacter saltans TaxID=151895 RepID=A0A2W5F440_9SPHI|nr:MAG: hypothetical protein DI598_07470 [Pseudopedobacter saltans]